MKKVTMIGNSHIDVVWLWRDREGLQAVRSTFASALERMEEFEEFEYTSSSSAFFLWLEACCPELLERIRRRVEEGRWHLAGGWWVEPDCNIPGGESLVRHGLYGQRELLRLFGRTAECAFNVDSFGHQAGIPSILAGQRIRGYVCMRPQPPQLALPGPAFRWKGEDGAEVIANRCEGEYCAWTRTAIVDNLDKTLAAMEKHGLDHLPAYYGVGNHGGGPTIENIKAIRELALERPDIELVNGGPEDFLREADASALPEWTGELEGCFPGCFTVDAELKRLCRAAEELLCKAEILCVMAGNEADTHPALTEAWRLLLFNQFHDTLAGTARKESRDDAASDLQRCLSVAREAAGGALQLLSNRLDTRGDGFPLLIVNPTDRPYTGLIDADVEWRTKFPMRLKDAQGREIPYDASSIRLTSPDTRKHFVFRGDIPAFGVAVYRLMPEAPTLRAEPMNCAPGTLENDHLRAAFDEQTGALVSLYDKDMGRELLAGPAGLIVYEDARDTWGAQGDATAVRGRYALEKMYHEESGALRSTLTLRMTHGRSEALLRYSLERDGHTLRLDAQVDSREKLAMTAYRLPLAQPYGEAIAEAAYTEQTRPYPGDAEAHNMQRTLDLVGEDGGLLLANRAKFGYRALDGALELLLTRGAVHAFGSGERVRDDREYDYADQGLDTWTLTLTPHAQPLSRAERVRIAQRLHREIEVLLIEQHTGPDPRRTWQPMALEGCEDAVVTAVKRGEDGGVALRVQSCSGQAQTGTFRLRGRTYPISLPPYALGTFLLDGERMTPVDLLEICEEK